MRLVEFRHFFASSAQPDPIAIMPSAIVKIAPSPKLKGQTSPRTAVMVDTGHGSVTYDVEGLLDEVIAKINVALTGEPTNQERFLAARPANQSPRSANRVHPDLFEG
jgi:hypothetical protein